MKSIICACLTLLCSAAYAGKPDISIPESTIKLIKTTDCVEVTGTNDMGGAENFTIHNAKAIGQFVKFLTSDIYLAVPKEPKPEFKSLSRYKVRLSCQGAPVLEFDVVADSILDLPNETSYYMESDRHSDNLMAPLLRLR